MKIIIDTEIKIVTVTPVNCENIHIPFKFFSEDTISEFVSIVSKTLISAWRK